MNFLKFLRLKKTTHEKAIPHEAYPYADILHLWEDDSLMIELLPSDNLDFVKSETNRINNFGKEHFDGSGFTDITPISEKPVKTIDKHIDITEVEKMMTQAGLEKVNKFVMQGVGLLQDDRAPLGFGTNKFAIICHNQNGELKDISFTGRTSNDEDKKNLTNALSAFGQTYNFILVNWYQGEHYSLVDRNNLEDFVRNT